MVGVFPIAIGASIIGIGALLFFALGGNLRVFLGTMGSAYQEKIDRADLGFKPEEFVLALLGISIVLWLLIVFLIHQTV